MVSACINNDEVVVASDGEKELISLDESVAVKHLTAEMSTMALRYSDVRCSTRSWRNFWRRFATLVYNDACGYAWGRRQGLPWQLSLGCGAAASLFTAFHLREVELSVSVSVSDEVVGYKSKTMIENIGQAHNWTVFTVVDGNMSELDDVNEELVADVNNTVNLVIDMPSVSFRNGETIADALEPVEEEAVKQEYDFVQIMGQMVDIDVANEKACSLIANADYSDDMYFLKEYVCNIIDINDKAQIRLFTEEVNDGIDDLGLSPDRTFDLKTMIAIAENSYLLWIISEK